MDGNDSIYVYVAVVAALDSGVLKFGSYFI